MKAVLILSLMALAMATTYETQMLWESWKVVHGKSYSDLEETARFGIFSHNYRKIAKFNAENEDVKLALNKFADLTAPEFKAKMTGFGFYESNQALVQEHTIALPEDFGVLPASVDWRNKGAVTPVKDQGQCGSCWSFSTTGVLEGFYFIHSGKLLSFSEQQIVDCDTTTNQGCDGGWPYLAVQYAAKNGLELESDYPYTAQDGDCKYDKSKTTSVAGGYKFVTAGNTVSLKTALVNQPVSVLVEADQDAFQFYSSGVLKTGCGASLDHAVLAVGYTKVGVLEAFIVKNSWGTDWGEQGYIYLWSSQTANSGKGVCGVLSQPMVPVA